MVRTESSGGSGDGGVDVALERLVLILTNLALITDLHGTLQTTCVFSVAEESYMFVADDDAIKNLEKRI